MSVQGGGGGGKKIPPAGASSPRAGQPPPAAGAKTAPDGTRPPSPTQATTTRSQSPKDRFEPSQFKSAGDSHGLDDAFGQASSASGVDNLVRVLDASRAQIAAEHRALRSEAQALVDKWVASGFAPAQLDQVRGELRELRRKMAALRKRLHHLQRRLKSTFASAGRTGDANFARLLGAQLERLRELGPGVARAILVLQTIEQAYGPFAEGSTPVLRLDPGEDHPEDRARIVDAVAVMAPGDAVARAALALLREGTAADPPARPATSPPAGLDGMRALADALVVPRPQE